MSYTSYGTWPPGTCSVLELPADILNSLLKQQGVTLLNQIVSVTLPVQESATEGKFVNYADYKIRVTITPDLLVHFA